MVGGSTDWGVYLWNFGVLGLADIDRVVLFAVLVFSLRVYVVGRDGWSYFRSSFVRGGGRGRTRAGRIRSFLVFFILLILFILFFLLVLLILLFLLSFILLRLRFLWEIIRLSFQTLNRHDISPLRPRKRTLHLRLPKHILRRITPNILIRILTCHILFSFLSELIIRWHSIWICLPLKKTILIPLN